jgi:hypothetical protein
VVGACSHSPSNQGTQKQRCTPTLIKPTKLSSKLNFYSKPANLKKGNSSTFKPHAVGYLETGPQISENLFHASDMY